MNIHIETSDIWVEELQPKKVQHIPSTNKWAHLMTYRRIQVAYYTHTHKNR